MSQDKPLTRELELRPDWKAIGYFTLGVSAAFDVCGVKPWAGIFFAIALLSGLICLLEGKRNG